MHTNQASTARVALVTGGAGGGIGLRKQLGLVSDAEFDRLIDTDLRAAFRFSRAKMLHSPVVAT